MKKLNISCILLFLMFIPFISSSIQVNISSNLEYNLGEEIYFDYEIYSDIPQTIYYFADFNCPTAPITLLAAFSRDISPENPIKERVNYPNLTEGIESQNCSAVVFIKSPEKIMVTKNLSFVAKENIDISLETCKDSFCFSPSKVFESGSEVYFNYTISNNVSQLDKFEAKVIYPNGKGKEISVPGEESFNEIGTYYFNIFASKEGYNEVNKSEMFSIIKESANISYSNLSYSNEFFKESKNESSFYSIILISLIIAFILVLVAYFIIKHFMKKE